MDAGRLLHHRRPRSRPGRRAYGRVRHRRPRCRVLPIRDWRSFLICPEPPIARGNYYSLGGASVVGDLFDSPWKILIIALVVMVLFGSEKLPSAARSLGQSMRIMQKEVHGLHEEEPESHPPGPPAAARAPAGITAGAPGGQPARQAQAGALPQQAGDLQRAAGVRTTCGG